MVNGGSLVESDGFVVVSIGVFFRKGWQMFLNRFVFVGLVGGLLSLLGLGAAGLLNILGIL